MVSVQRGSPCHIDTAELMLQRKCPRLSFKTEPEVDGIFRTLAYSIVDGPLSSIKANVHTVKAVCCDQLRDSHQYLFSLCFENV